MGSQLVMIQTACSYQTSDDCDKRWDGAPMCSSSLDDQIRGKWQLLVALGALHVASSRFFSVLGSAVNLVPEQPGATSTRLKHFVGKIPLLKTWWRSRTSSWFESPGFPELSALSVTNHPGPEPLPGSLWSSEGLPPSGAFMECKALVGNCCRACGFESFLGIPSSIRFYLQWFFFNSRNDSGMFELPLMICCLVLSIRSLKHETYWNMDSA